MFLLKMLVGLCLLLAGFLSQASEVWGEKGFHHFVESLPKATPEALNQITNNYDAVLTERLKIQGDKVRLASFKDIDPVLRRAVEGKMGVLDHPPLRLLMMGRPWSTVTSRSLQQKLFIQEQEGDCFRSKR